MKGVRTCEKGGAARDGDQVGSKKDHEAKGQTADNKPPVYKDGENGKGQRTFRTNAAA